MCGSREMVVDPTARVFGGKESICLLPFPFHTLLLPPPFSHLLSPTSLHFSPSPPPPTQAIHCCLHGITEIEDEACEKFSELAADKTCVANVMDR